MTPSPLDPAALLARTDADVPAAVRRALEAFLDRRLTEAATVDAIFTADVARRLADFALGGGSRRRSALVWWAWRACAAPADDSARAVLDVAASVELVQSCALVHDDVMDGSLLRRGRPSVHVDFARQYPGGGAPGAGAAAPFGWSAAVLVGDLALAWADDLLAEAELSAGARSRLRPVWAAMRTEMVAGQYLDLHAQTTGERSPARAMRMAYLKSALYSAERPLALGAALAGADAADARALRDAGRCAGVAFQLYDDLLGVFGDPRRTGKPSGDDIREGKLTYVTAVARVRAEKSGDKAALRVLDDAVGDRALSSADLAAVREALTRTGARAVVVRRIDRLMERCAARLSAAPLTPRARTALLDVLEASTGRGPAMPR